jgi:hypothetical protein
LSEYAILQLPGVRVPENREPLGSKQKLWWRDPSGSEPRLLFKYNRPGTGEDWSEKIAAELAQELGLPHSQVELATVDGSPGVAIFDFTDNGQTALVHGNELLEVVDPEYPKEKRRRAPEYTVAAVYNILARPGVGLPGAPIPFPAEVIDAFGVFLGYLMLDAWIGNTDRHHENWGLLWRGEGAPRPLTLAPSFDHASSLGRELTDDKRTRVGSTSQGTPTERYARRAKSAFCENAGSGRPLKTWEAFQSGGKARPEAAAAWLGRLRAVTPETVCETVDRVPGTRMNAAAKAFACALLQCNAKLLGA